MNDNTNAFNPNNTKQSQIEPKPKPLNPKSIFSYLYSNENPFPHIHPQLTLSHLTDQTSLQFQSKLTPLSQKPQSQISLIPVDEELKEVLQGGFRLGHSYEIKGPSLSGKTLFINTLLYSNLNRITKCLLYDFIGSNLWKIDWEGKVDVINDLYSITEVLHSIKQIPKGKYTAVVFDPLAIILSKQLEYPSETIQEFSNEINNLLYKKNTTVLFTSSARQLEQRECIDENTRMAWFEREYDSETPLLFLPINKTEICLYRKHQDERQHFFVGRLYANVTGPNAENNYIELPSLSG